MSELIVERQTEHLDRLLNTPIFDDEDLLELSKNFPEDD